MKTPSGSRFSCTALGVPGETGVADAEKTGRDTLSSGTRW